MEYNINYYIWVKLTDKGRAIYREHYDWLVRQGYDHVYVPPKENKDGWSKWQMWMLMDRFGEYCHMGGDLPFETTVHIGEDEPKNTP